MGVITSVTCLVAVRRADFCSRQASCEILGGLGPLWLPLDGENVMVAVCTWDTP